MIRRIVLALALLFALVFALPGVAMADWDLDLATVRPSARATPAPKPAATPRPSARATLTPRVMPTLRPTSRPTPAPTTRTPQIKPVEALSGALGAVSSSYLSGNKYLVDASCAIDGDLKTCWTEGVDGYGVGEWLMLSADEPCKVAGVNIVNGYAKSDDAFNNNTRVKQIEVYVDGESVGSFTLSDSKAWQTIRFERAYAGYDFLFEIKSVYPGKKYKDSCLTEIELWSDAKNARDTKATAQPRAAAAKGVSKYERASDVPKDGYFCPDSAKKLLEPEDLKSTSKEVLGYIRNEILARHGYVFKTSKYKNYFSARTWYRANPGFSYDLLNSTETTNIERIKDAEG